MKHLKTTMLLICLSLSGMVFANDTIKVKPTQVESRVTQKKTDRPSVKLYQYLIHYSEKYGVPFNIAYGIARKESGYLGPNHSSYNPAVIIGGGSNYGAMQVRTRTADHVWQTRGTTKHKLLNDLEFNVETSMKLMAHLKKRYGSWGLALGAYNTGRPVLNSYAKKILKFQP